jgi:hypothetical protein
MFGVAVSIWGLVLLIATLGYARSSGSTNACRCSRPDWTVVALSAARDLTALGSTTVLVFMIASVAGYLLLERRTGMLGFVLVATCGGGLIVNVLKPLFARPRPSVVPHLVSVVELSERPFAPIRRRLSDARRAARPRHEQPHHANLPHLARLRS